MLHEDGRIVFLDFGLMTRVDQSIMEGFARGIQALLSEDWRSLTESFVDVGFVTEPIMHRDGLNDSWRVDPNFGIDQLATELAAGMEDTEGGKARFGALATVLNKKISPTWLVFTPPYVLLLIRTFLTLEGTAAKLDPDFNIYEMAMPWAARRSLSPSTQKGIDVFRLTFMTPDNRIQWERLLELANKNEDDNDALLKDSNKAALKKVQNEAAKNAAMSDAVGTLLGAPEGKALRRAIRDLDSTDLFNKLATKDGRQLLLKALEARSAKRKKQQLLSTQESQQRPTSEAYLELREKQARWRRKVNRLLVMSHARRLFRWQGLTSFVRLSSAFVRVLAKFVVVKFRKLFPGKVATAEPSL